MATNDWKTPTFYRPNRAFGLGQDVDPTAALGLPTSLDTNLVIYGVAALVLGSFVLGGVAEPQRRYREGKRKKYEERAKYYREKAAKYGGKRDKD